MSFKPMEEAVYVAYLKMVGWRLSKAGIDYSLLDEAGAFVCTIKVGHGKGKFFFIRVLLAIDGFKNIFFFFIEFFYVSRVLT